MMQDELLQVCGLFAGYGTGDVLRGIDLTVKRGEVVAIIGRNGAGKSTLMRALMGLAQTRQDRLRFNGAEMSALPTHRRARAGIGFVPQGRGLFPKLTVAQNVRMGDMVGSECARELAHFSRSSAVFERYFPVLQEHSTRRAGLLSGGEQQQVALARALVASPDLLLLDEPSEGIQPSVVAAIAANLAALNREHGLTLLFVEQNVEMIRRLAQRCLLLDRGQIAEELAPSVFRDRDALVRYLAV